MFREFQFIDDQIALKDYDCNLTVRRLDKIHNQISGNKYFKLKYNVIEARELGKTTLVTFGGAFSNHIVAVAKIGKEFGFKTVGIIRGEELEQKSLNPTLKQASENNMQLVFVTRDAYRNKNSIIEQMAENFGEYYAIPEGGTNRLAVKGCEEIMQSKDTEFDYICTAVGTGGTTAGIVNRSGSHQQVLGFSALKGDFLKKDIKKYSNKNNWQLITKYHFGGYAKINRELISFINQFKKDNNLPLDPVYTGKMMYGICDLLSKDFFKPRSNILAIHTGGLQGIAGMNLKLTNQNLPLIDL